MLFAVLFTLLTVFAGCGGDDGNSNKTKNSSFDGSVGESDVSYESEKTEAGQFSAQITGNIITIYLMPSAGKLITITGVTDQDNKLPGTLNLHENGLTYTEDAKLMTYIYESGTVKIDKCPGNVGDIFTGTLDVVVKSIDGSTTLPIKASFSVTVLSTSGAKLHCSESSSSSDSEVNTPKKCGYDSKECDGGVCCPFEECMSKCVLDNCMSDCKDSQDPNAMMACMECMSGCERETCASKMTDACQTAYTALDKCMDTNGCDGILADEATLSCARSNCCSEMQAAYQK